MQTIQLTQGKVAIVDDCDYEWLNQWKWHYNNCYAAHADYSVVPKRMVYMHRAILEAMGFKDFEKSDHINRNRLDNRRCNLRPATARQSSCNRGRPKTNKSGYTGVRWCSDTKKWRACVYMYKRTISLGHFEDIKEAAQAYNEAARKYYGEFAVLNDIDKE